MAIQEDKILAPLHVAAQYGQGEVVKLLLDRGADIGAGTQEGKTALHLAVQSRAVAMVKQLHSLGADTGARDQDGKTPLDSARSEAAKYPPWTSGKAKANEIVKVLES